MMKCQLFHPYAYRITTLQYIARCNAYGMNINAQANKSVPCWDPDRIRWIPKLIVLLILNRIRILTILSRFKDNSEKSSIFYFFFIYWFTNQFTTYRILLQWPQKMSFRIRIQTPNYCYWDSRIRIRNSGLQIRGSGSKRKYIQNRNTWICYLWYGRQCRHHDKRLHGTLGFTGRHSLVKINYKL